MKYYILYILYFSLLFNSNAQNWIGLNWGNDRNGISALYCDSIENYIYAIGTFSEVNGNSIKGISRWNGLNWDSLGKGIDGLDTINSTPNATFCITKFKNDIYVGGAFSSLGNVKANSIGKWNGINWDTLSIQPSFKNNNCTIYHLNEIGNELYVSGAFDSIGNISSNSIAKWDGANWHTLNFPTVYPSQIYTYARIYSTCIYKNELYVAGSFFSQPIDTIGNILAFNGTSWHTVGGGIKGNTGGIYSMSVFNNELYIAGYFNSANGNYGNNIQKWNGISWSYVGDSFIDEGTDNSINSILTYQNKLYIFGNFDHAGGIEAHKIAYWNDTTWCALGGNFDNYLSSGVIFKDTLYVGGHFITIDADSIHSISKWMGGIYVDTCSLSSNVTEINELDFSIFPNPVYNSLYLNSESKCEKIEIFDLMGRKLFILNPAELMNSIDFSKFQTGLYIIKVSYKNNIFSKKIMKL